MLASIVGMILYSSNRWKGPTLDIRDRLICSKVVINLSGIRTVIHETFLCVPYQINGPLELFGSLGPQPPYMSRFYTFPWCHGS
jgi:hypothetical protein